MTDKFSIVSDVYSHVNGTQSYNSLFAENDSIFLYNHTLYIKGVKKVLPKNGIIDDTVKKYKLKKIDNFSFFNYNAKNKKDFFEYNDLILKTKIKASNGYAKNLVMKNNQIIQYIDIEGKPILLQTIVGENNYQFIIKPEYYKEENYLGNGLSNVFLYDIDKDKKEEIVIVLSDEINMIAYAQVYKIITSK